MPASELLMVSRQIMGGYREPMEPMESPLDPPLNIICAYSTRVFSICSF